MQCTCERDDIPVWDVMLLARLKTKSAAAHRVLSYSNAQLAALSPAARAVARGYDAVLGGHLLATIQASTPRAKLIRAIIAEREEDAPGTIASSGRAVRAIILESTSPTYGSELNTLESDLKKPFFTMGMTRTSPSGSAARGSRRSASSCRLQRAAGIASFSSTSLRNSPPSSPTRQRNTGTACAWRTCATSRTSGATPSSSPCCLHTSRLRAPAPRQMLPIYLAMAAVAKSAPKIMKAASTVAATTTPRENVPQGRAPTAGFDSASALACVARSPAALRRRWSKAAKSPTPTWA